MIKVYWYWLDFSIHFGSCCLLRFCPKFGLKHASHYKPVKKWSIVPNWWKSRILFTHWVWTPRNSSSSNLMGKQNPSSRMCVHYFIQIWSFSSRLSTSWWSLTMPIAEFVWLFGHRRCSRNWQKLQKIHPGEWGGGCSTFCHPCTFCYQGDKTEEDRTYCEASVAAVYCEASVAAVSSAAMCACVLVLACMHVCVCVHASVCVCVWEGGG